MAKRKTKSQTPELGKKPTLEEHAALVTRLDNLLKKSGCDGDSARGAAAELLARVVMTTADSPQEAATDVRAIADALARAILQKTDVGSAAENDARAAAAVKSILAGGNDSYFPEGAPASRSIYYDKKPVPKREGAIKESRPRIIMPPTSNRKH